MTERQTIEAHWGYKPFVLKSGEVAEKGKLACLDTTQSGKVVVGATSTTLIPIGIFAESRTGDGTLTISVKMFREIQLVWWKNDAAHLLAASDIGKWAYIKDGETMTALGTGGSVGGIVLDVSAAKGVLVFSDPALMMAANVILAALAS